MTTKSDKKGKKEGLSEQINKMLETPSTIDFTKLSAEDLGALHSHVTQLRAMLDPYLGDKSISTVKKIAGREGALVGAAADEIVDWADSRPILGPLLRRYVKRKMESKED